MTTKNQLITDVARRLKLKSVRTGTWSKTLQIRATEHAKAQARKHKISHAGFEHRAAEIMALMPGYEVSEIVAYSGGTAEKAAETFFKEWRQSSDHWSAANGRCSFYAYSMARSSKGVWYACAIFLRK
jgi:uncharacterized protein YkwD